MTFEKTWNRKTEWKNNTPCFLEIKKEKVKNHLHQNKMYRYFLAYYIFIVLKVYAIVVFINIRKKSKSIYISGMLKAKTAELDRKKSLVNKQKIRIPQS